jgi:hypothetical protein
MIAQMLLEFDRYMAYHDVKIEARGGVSRYSTREGTWTLHRRMPGDPLPNLGRGETLLTDVAVADDERALLRQQGVFWLDLRGKSRSASGTPLTEELATFISRYGIRLPRD